MAIHIGISGWRYVPWRGVFFPKGLAQARELEYASRALPTTEINGTFYSLQRPESYAAWYDATPPGFVFSVKANRFITHMLKLKEIDAPVCNVLASGMFNLREKLGPMLWQFPPQMPFDPERMEHFLSILPHDTDQAAEMAARYEPRMEGRVALDPGPKRPMRHAVEIRHQSFVDPAFVAMLRKYKVAMVVADTAGKWPNYEDVTADFMYLRLHGDEELYASGYSDAALDRWAERIRGWTSGKQPIDARLISSKPAPRKAKRDLYCYFDNDIKVHAPFDAKRLMERLGLTWGDAG